MKKYSRLSFMVLTIILSLMVNIVREIDVQKAQINELNTGVVSTQFSTSNLDPGLYNELFDQLDQIEGVTMTNTYYENNGEPQKTLFVDEQYNNEYINKLVSSGEGLSTDDFTIIFDETTTIPVLVSESYATNNNLRVGDSTTMENYLPNICEIYSNSQSFITSSDGTSVQNGESNNKDLCQSDSKYDYLETENGFSKIPITIKGIYKEPESGLAGLDIYNNPQIDIISPSFIVDNVNTELYDLDRYENHQKIYPHQLVLGLLDYDVLNDDEFVGRVNQIEQDFNTNIDFERASEWQENDYSEQIKMYNQTLVNYTFIAILFLIIIIVYEYYKQQLIKYQFAVLYLLGCNKKTIIKYEVLNNLKIDALQLVVVLSFGILNNTLVLSCLLFVLIYLVDLIINLFTYNNLMHKNLQEALIEGEK